MSIVSIPLAKQSDLSALSALVEQMQGQMGGGIKQIQSGSYRNTIKYKYYNDTIQLMCDPITIQPVDAENSILIVKNAVLLYETSQGSYHGAYISAHNTVAYTQSSGYYSRFFYVLNQLNPILTSNSINIYNDSVSVSPPEQFYILTMSAINPPTNYSGNAYYPGYSSNYNDSLLCTKITNYDYKVYPDQNWRSCISSISYSFDWEIIEFN